VDADLVRPTGLEPDREQRRAGKPLDRLDMGHRLATLDRTIDGLRGHLADRDRAVHAIDIVTDERIAEQLVRRAGPREHEQAARRQIDPVDEVELAELSAQLIEQVAAITLGRRRG